MKAKIIIPAIAAIAAIVVAVILIAFSPAQPAFDNIPDTAAMLSTAQQYLFKEKNYEQAIVEFEKVLEIDPMNADAYLGIAAAYEALGDIEKAIEWLEKGYDLTSDSRIKEMLDRLTAPQETETEAVTSAPEETQPEPETEPAVQLAVVPDLSGLSTGEAVSLCEQAGINYKILDGESDTVELGYVISQLIPAGAEVGESTVLSFVVSTKNTKAPSETAAPSENAAPSVTAFTSAETSVTPVTVITVSETSAALTQKTETSITEKIKETEANIKKPDTPQYSVTDTSTGKAVKLLSENKGAVIYYTTDGTSPNSSSLKYSTAINTDKDCTIKAVAVKDGKQSNILTIKVSVSELSPPSASPASGTTLNKGDKVTLTAGQGCTIYYTTDSSEPTVNSSVYRSPIAINNDTTIKAIAMKSGSTPGKTVQFTYKCKKTFTLSGTIYADTAKTTAANNVQVTVKSSAYNKSCYTDASGVYKLENIPEGQYTVEVDYLSFAKNKIGSTSGITGKCSSTVTINNDTISDINLSLKLEKNKLTGTVYLDDRKSAVVNNAKLTLRGGSYNKTLYSDNSGKFTFTDIPGGSYTIEIDASDYLREKYGVISNADGKESRTLTINDDIDYEFFLNPDIQTEFTLSGTVYTDKYTMTPVSGAMVTLSGDNYSKTVNTSAEGRYVFEKVPKGYYRLELDYSGYISANYAGNTSDDYRDVKNLEIEADTNLDVFSNIVIKKGFTVRGNIYSDDTQTTGAAETSVTLKGNGYSETRYTNFDGGYSFNEVPAGDYTIIFDCTSCINVSYPITSTMNITVNEDCDLIHYVTLRRTSEYISYGIAGGLNNYKIDE